MDTILGIIRMVLVNAAVVQDLICTNKTRDSLRTDITIIIPIWARLNRTGPCLVHPIVVVVVVAVHHARNMTISLIHSTSNRITEDVIINHLMNHVTTTFAPQTCRLFRCLHRLIIMVLTMVQALNLNHKTRRMVTR